MGGLSFPTVSCVPVSMMPEGFMRASNLPRIFLPALVALIWSASAAQALVVTATATGSGFTTASDGAPPGTTAFCELTGSSRILRASGDITGNAGVSIGIGSVSVGLGGGSFDSTVTLSEDFVNPAAGPQHVQLSSMIFPGGLHVAGDDVLASYSISVSLLNTGVTAFSNGSLTSNADGTALAFARLEEGTHLSAPNAGPLNPGESVDIPLSTALFDLGNVNPGPFTVVYTMNVHVGQTALHLPLESAGASLGDPLNLQASGPFFDPLSLTLSDVPDPATGVVAIFPIFLGLRRRR
jgi:hypothetical protein